MKRVLSLSLLMLGVCPLAQAAPQQQGFRCEQIADQAAKDAAKELRDAARSADTRVLARAHGHSCWTLKRGLDTVNGMRCAPDVVEGVKDAYVNALATVDDVNARHETHATCTYDGGYK